MRELWQQFQVQMRNNEELSCTSSIFGAKARVETDNQHDKHADTLAHLLSSLHNDMAHFHTCIHSCTLGKVLTHSHRASYKYMTNL